MTPSNRQLHWQKTHIDTRPCAACALYDFNQIGIYGVKIVGRENITAKKVTDITFIKDCIDYLKQQRPEREKYIERTKKLYQKTYGCSCRSYICYYPTVK